MTKEMTRTSFECTRLEWMTLRSPSELESGSFRTCHGVPYSAFSGWTFNCTPTSSPGDTDCSPATTRFEYSLQTGFWHSTTLMTTSSTTSGGLTNHTSISTATLIPTTPSTGGVSARLLWYLSADSRRR